MNHYDPVPKLTYHYTGFVNGDNSTNSGIIASVNTEHHGDLNEPRRLLPDQADGQFVHGTQLHPWGSHKMGF